MAALTGALDHHQLTLILDVLGTPTMEDYYGIKSRRAREYIRSLPFKKKIPLKHMFPKTSDLALDLLEKLLAFNPVKRITVEEALRHPYLEPYHDPEDEPTANPIPEEFFDFDKNKDSLTKEELKRKIGPGPSEIVGANDATRADLCGNHEIRSDSLTALRPLPKRSFQHLAYLEKQLPSAGSRWDELQPFFPPHLDRGGAGWRTLA